MKERKKEEIKKDRRKRRKRKRKSWRRCEKDLYEAIVVGRRTDWTAAEKGVKETGQKEGNERNKRIQPEQFAVCSSSAALPSLCGARGLRARIGLGVYVSAATCVCLYVCARACMGARACVCVTPSQTSRARVERIPYVACPAWRANVCARVFVFRRNCAAPCSVYIYASRANCPVTPKEHARRFYGIPGLGCATAEASDSPSETINAAVNSG